MLAQVFANLSDEMSDGWQMLDGCVRMLKLAGRSADFAESPNIAAVITDAISTLSTLISHHQSKGHTNGSAPMSASPNEPDQPEDDGDTPDPNAFASADADTVPG